MQAYDISEGIWQLYVTDCQMHETTPSIKDFIVWSEEKGYELPELAEI